MSTPEKLGKYKIARVIGKGAMGIVYEGFDPVIERTVAIKTIRVDELDEAEAEEHSRRFKVEAKAAGKLNHPNIVGIYDYGEEQNLAYIVMEFVQGKELKSYLDEGHRFPVKQIVHIMGQLLDALGYSHARGVIHRDVKPANVFITEDGNVKLGDFGIARIDSTHKTHAGTILGTPSYMSPEQIKGDSVDNRSDLYSCGVILYQFLTGEKPFTGSMVAVMHKVLAEEPPPPSSRNPQVTLQMDRVVARAMAKQLESRYANAREFSDALRAAAGSDSDDDDAEATRIFNVRDLMASAPAADQTRGGGADATSQTARTESLAESEIEIEFWRSIKDSADADDFDIYLKKYPQGHYAELAQLKLSKLRRADKTLSPAARDADQSIAGSTGITGITGLTGLTGTSRIEEIRRKTEEARRKAEEEMRRAEEELLHAEEAQHQAEEEARKKVADSAAETASLAAAARSFSARVAEVLDSKAVKQGRSEIVTRAGELQQQAAALQDSLREILKSSDVLKPDVLAQANQAQTDCGEAAAATQAALQQFEAAFNTLLSEIQSKVEIITRHGHSASQTLQETERLAASALASGVSAQALADVRQAAARLQAITGDAREHIQRVLQDQDLLQPEVLKTVQTAESAYERAENKARESVAKVEQALRQAEEEAKRKAEEEARRQAEEEEKRRAEEEAKRQAEAEAKRRAEEEAKRQAEEEAKRKAEEEAKRQAEEEARRQAEVEAQRKAEEEAKRQAEEEAKRQAEVEAKRKAEEEAKRQAEAEAKRKAEEEAKRKAEEESKRQAEAEAKRKAEEKSKRTAEEEARRQAEAETKRKAEEEAKRKAEEEAKRKAEEEAKRQADAEAKRKAEEEAKRQSEEEAKHKAEEEAKRKAAIAESDETLVVPAGKRPELVDSDETIMVTAPAPNKSEPAPAPRPVEKAAPATPAAAAEKKGLPIVPIAIGGIAVVGVIGWLMSRGPAEPAVETPTAPPVSQTTAQPEIKPPEVSAASKAAAEQSQAAANAANEARQKAEEQQRKVLEAKQAIEDAKRLGDAKQAEAARLKAEEQVRKAEEAQRKAIEDARRAEDEARRKAAEEARLKAEAESRRKAEIEAQRKAAEEEARRKAAEAEYQRKAEEDSRRKAAEAETQRKAAEEESRRRAAEAEAQRKAQEEQTKAKPVVPAGAPGELFQQARVLEGEGRYAEAVRLYKQAGNAGHGPASKRLGEIYLKGAKGVSRDYAESVRWYAKARQQGMDIPN